MKCNNAQVIRMPFFAILYAEKLAKAKTLTETEIEIEMEMETKSKTNFIKLDVTETKSLKLGPQPKMDLTSQDCSRITAKDTNDPKGAFAAGYA